VTDHGAATGGWGGILLLIILDDDDDAGVVLIVFSVHVPTSRSCQIRRSDGVVVSDVPGVGEPVPGGGDTGLRDCSAPGSSEYGAAASRSHRSSD